MAVTFGKKEVGRMAEVLDEDFETVEEAAKAVLLEAADIIASRSKFTVVGQKLRGVDGPTDPASPDAVKISLGDFSTAGTAQTAARSLVFSASTGEEFRAWVLDRFYGSPAEYFKARKNAQKLEAQGLTPADKFSHLYHWREDNPDLTHDDYPGPPEPDPRTNCPVCGTEQEGGDE